MAEWKAKQGQLTPAELLMFGILPPEVEKPESLKRHEQETLDKTDPVPCVD